MGSRIVSATEFRSKWQSLLDEVEEHGETVTITRRGRVVAELQPPKKKAFKPLKNMFAGRIQIIGDIVNTPDITDLFEDLKEDRKT